MRTGWARHAPLAARHLIEVPLPAGKTWATFDFKALPSLPRARVEALVAGDWPQAIGWTVFKFGAVAT